MVNKKEEINSDENGDNFDLVLLTLLWQLCVDPQEHLMHLLCCIDTWTALLSQGQPSLPCGPPWPWSKIRCCMAHFWLGMSLSKEDLLLLCNLLHCWPKVEEAWIDLGWSLMWFYHQEHSVGKLLQPNKKHFFSRCLHPWTTPTTTFVRKCEWGK